MGLFSREAQTVEVAGRRLQCQVCGYGLFWHERAQLHGGLATFLGMEWTSPTADCYLCGQCGYVHWFLPLQE